MRVPPKNIIISHVYSSDNKGDAALTSVLVRDLRRQFPQANLRILKLEPGGENQDFEGVPESPAFMQYALNKYRHPLAKLAYVLYMLPATLLWAFCWRYMRRSIPLPGDLRVVAKAYANSDLIVAVGGGYIRSRKGLANCLNVPLLLHPLLFGYILGKKTVLYPQSVGPFVHAFERPMVAFVLRRMTLIILREDTSVALLANLGVHENVVRSVDSGFLLQSDDKIDLHKKYQVPTGKLIMGVTVRSWLKGDAQAKYEQAVAEALDTMVEKFNVHVVFIPQVTAAKGDDDRLVSRRVHGYMRHGGAVTRITEKLGHYAIKAMYNQIDILLGTRFHSVIFSLTSHVPVLAIEYEHKTSGIMQDLGLAQWVLKIEDVTADNLVEGLSRLLHERKKYKRYLSKCLPPYVSKAEQTIAMLEESYYAPAQDGQAITT
jgi:colanic acid/amylovoran biosynthesis protein